ncbi:MAG: hypothetical protein QOF53_1074 [Nocardioidaceae bacterium]|nr:hypothetical protein [Nocardioidaceae bacterium]
MGFRQMLARGVVAAVAVVAAPLVTGGAASAATAPGVVYTWGSNSFGQLGNGSTATTPSAPAAVAGLSDVVDVDGGREHIAALTATGMVYTWGSNVEGQLGLGDSANRSIPTQVTVPCGASAVVDVATGHNSTLALCGSGAVWAWGLNSDGQLGDGTRTLRRSPVQVKGITDAVAIAAGRDMSYAIKADGTALAWGDNAFGELGDGTTTDRLAPVSISGLTNVTGIAGGRDHGLALRADGSVWAFGWNAYGQLGDGTLVNRLVPVQVTTGVTEVIAGAHHSYALRSDGQVLSWGRNYRDELGDGTTTNRTRPVQVIGVSSAVSIASGRDHGVAVMADGSVMTWGHNLSGQLGDGTTTNRSRAITVPGVSGATKAGGGGSEYSVVLVSTGPVANRAPTAKLSVSCKQLVCSVNGSGSVDPDGTISSYSWTFGDGGTATGSTASHTYGQPGTYTVSLTVTDNDGATGPASSPVTVSASPAPTLAFRAVATFDGNVMKPAVVVPAGVAPGDQLLLFVSTNRIATAATPAGWTLRGTVADGTDVKSWVFSRAAVTGTAGSSIQVGLDAFSKTNLTLLAYAGAGQPGAPVGAAEPGTTALHKAPAAAVVVAGSTVVTYWVDKTSTAHGWTLPANVTPRSQTVGSGTGMLTSASGDAGNVAAGTWPGATADAGTASAKAIAWTVVLPPA